MHGTVLGCSPSAHAGAQVDTNDGPRGIQTGVRRLEFGVRCCMLKYFLVIDQPV